MCVCGVCVWGGGGRVYQCSFFVSGSGGGLFSIFLLAACMTLVTGNTVINIEEPVEFEAAL